MKSSSPLTAISPLDGRYEEKVAALQPIFSEFGLMRFRLLVEIRWLEMLASIKELKELHPLNKGNIQFLNHIFETFSEADARRIKTIERKTNHDLKALEYFLKEKLAVSAELKHAGEFIHFACTSEDINNLAYALMTKAAREECLLPIMHQLIQHINTLATRYAEQPMLARTHGQPASPTTMGKEFANFSYRLQRQYQQFKDIPILGKINGAVGNYNAHISAYPYIDWRAVSKKFVESFALQWNPYTTQIEPHDSLAELLQTLMRFNTILIDFSRDIWGYISLNYLKQKSVKDEVGSSTMPHKINPIDFENAEGNLGIANALFDHMANKLPISRWQRDLTDSTVLRNLGVGFGHSLLAYQALLQGLNKLEVNKAILDADLENNWEVLGEAIQTILRKYHHPHPYEALKEFTRGQKITQEQLHQFIDRLDIAEIAKQDLKQLTPSQYIGLANVLAKTITS